MFQIDCRNSSKRPFGDLKAAFIAPHRALFEPPARQRDRVEFVVIRIVEAALLAQVAQLAAHSPGVLEVLVDVDRVTGDCVGLLVARGPVVCAQQAVLT